MSDPDRIRLEHMLAAAQEAVQFLSERQQESPAAERMTALAVIKCLEIVGEAASKVSVETRTSLPLIPWADIVGMRNRLIHGYFEVDMSLVWDTAGTDLPPLITVLEAILESRQ